jgi:hypothetical protein
VKLPFFLLAAAALAQSAWAQKPGALPRFEDFPVKEIFTGVPAEPVLNSPEERKSRTVIVQGVRKGWGVQDGVTGREVALPGPNFAGHFILVKWSCGSPCLMAAIVDAKTGRVLPPPFHRESGSSYFQVPYAFPMNPPLAYRLNSRLLIANICEAEESQKCGTHYFVMDDDGLRLIHAVLEQ